MNEFIPTMCREHGEVAEEAAVKLDGVYYCSLCLRVDLKRKLRDNLVKKQKYDSELIENQIS